jgi:uncharacterized protein (TIGR03382 family)
MRLVSIAIALCIASFSDRVEACICATEGLLALAPENGAADVPRTARIWIRESFTRTDQLLIVDSNEGAVAGRFDDFSEGNVRIHVFTPAEPFAADTSIQVHACPVPVDVLRAELGESFLDVCGVFLEFVTGTSLDEAAPARPEVTLRSSSASWDGGRSDCDGRSGIRATATMDVAHGGLFFVALRERDERLPDEIIGSSFDSVSTAQQVTFGTIACSAPWRDAEPGASAGFRFGAVDLSGNFSGFTDLFEVTLADAPRPPSEDGSEGPPRPSNDSGCSATGRPLSLAAFLLAVALRFRRRP